MITPQGTRNPKAKEKKTMTRWEVRFKNYCIPGSYRWETMKVFTNPGDADEWLMAYIRSNRYPSDDFTIRKVTD